METTLRSADTGELAKALASAQGLLKPLKKGRTAQIKSDKGAYSYSYADLADVIECGREPLTKNGLAATQTLRVEDGHMVLVTTLLHSSGQWIASEYPLQNYSRPQEQGSAITYARRYSLTSMLGIAAEDDDDGAAAQSAEPVKREAAPVSADAAAIVHLAAELEQVTGVNSEQIIRDASAFKGDKGPVSFTDPTTVKSAKWLKGVRDKLERELHKNGALAAVASEEIPF